MVPLFLSVHRRAHEHTLLSDPALAINEYWAALPAQKGSFRRPSPPLELRAKLLDKARDLLIVRR